MENPIFLVLFMCLVKWAQSAASATAAALCGYTCTCDVTHSRVSEHSKRGCQPFLHPSKRGLWFPAYKNVTENVAGWLKYLIFSNPGYFYVLYRSVMVLSVSKADSRSISRFNTRKMHLFSANCGVCFPKVTWPVTWFVVLVIAYRCQGICFKSHSANRSYCVHRNGL